MDLTDKDTWLLINSFSPWLAAFGTIAAVVVSLYLSRNDWKVNLRVRAMKGSQVMMGSTLSQGTEIISVEVTNLGRRSAIINNIYWKTGILRKKTYVWIPPVNPSSSRIPVKLEDGQQASFVQFKTDFESNFTDIFREALAGWIAPLKARLICVGVSTSLSEQFERRIEKSLRNHLLKICK